jgi:hypothetical protein
MWLRMVQLEQGFGTSEMGFNGAIAGQQFQNPNVSYGSWPCKNGLMDIGRGSQDPGVSQATIAAIKGLTPTMFMTRVRL